ncbi:hypothetical protein GCM10010102_15500 [Promicromonospora citrea]|uniref:Uncharacterized protein n=1 Tax=Promicromonospora citrea TaxID=43677 RepID=A0A8H9GI58_9MICO|nr:hypothetical protein GCM10010102_15500 [Promicromonospora citrea]
MTSVGVVNELRSLVLGLSQQTTPQPPPKAHTMSKAGQSVNPLTGQTLAKADPYIALP